MGIRASELDRGEVVVPRGWNLRESLNEAPRPEAVNDGAGLDQGCTEAVRDPRGILQLRTTGTTQMRERRHAAQWEQFRDGPHAGQARRPYGTPYADPIGYPGRDFRPPYADRSDDLAGICEPLPEAPYPPRTLRTHPRSLSSPYSLRSSAGQVHMANGSTASQGGSGSSDPWGWVVDLFHNRTFRICCYVIAVVIFFF